MKIKIERAKDIPFKNKDVKDIEMEIEGDIDIKTYKMATTIEVTDKESGRKTFFIFNGGKNGLKSAKIINYEDTRTN